MAVRINVAIESSLRRFGIVRKVKRSQAVFMWEDIVGPAAAKVSTAVTCRDGILFCRGQEFRMGSRAVIAEKGYNKKTESTF